MPSHRIIRGIQARAGTGRMISNRGLVNSSKSAPGHADAQRDADEHAHGIAAQGDLQAGPDVLEQRRAVGIRAALQLVNKGAENFGRTGKHHWADQMQPSQRTKQAGNWRSGGISVSSKTASQVSPCLSSYCEGLFFEIGGIPVYSPSFCVYIWANARRRNAAYL